MSTTVPVLYGNQPGLPWIIQKFSSTSNKLLCIIPSLVKQYIQQHQLVMVCSTRNEENKQRGTTDQLLSVALKPESEDYLAILSELQADHEWVARTMIKQPEIRDQLILDIRETCGRLKTFLGAIRVIHELSPRSRDVIISAGERLSCRILVAVLQDNGVDAVFVPVDMIDQEFALRDQHFHDCFAKRVASCVRQCGNKVPVLAGHIVPSSLLASFGSDHTDVCAALSAVGLGAQELQIWRNVEGIFTADPRKVKSARLITLITPKEAAELTYYGAKVIHPIALEQVIRANIPIRIKNVKNPHGQGTVVFPTNALGENDLTTPPHSPKVLAENSPSLDLTTRPTAVTIKEGVTVLNVHSNRKSVSHDFFAKIFSTLDRYSVVVDLVSTSEVHVSMAFNADSVKNSLTRIIADLQSVGKVDVLNNMAILSLVGKQMKIAVGIAGLMFSTLASAAVNIEMISHGASEISISCVIEEAKAVQAVNAIHYNLLSHPSDSVTPWKH